MLNHSNESNGSSVNACFSEWIISAANTLHRGALSKSNCFRTDMTTWVGCYTADFLLQTDVTPKPQRVQPCPTVSNRVQPCPTMSTSAFTAPNEPDAYEPDAYGLGTRAPITTAEERRVQDQIDRLLDEKNAKLKNDKQRAERAAKEEANAKVRWCVGALVRWCVGALVRCVYVCDVCMYVCMYVYVGRLL